MTKVKICGITSLEDALDAVNLGADALGFNFYEKSPRYISPEAARSIILQLPDDLSKVGIFVNESSDDVLENARMAEIDTIQFHGDETPHFVSEASQRTGLAVIRALRVTQSFKAENAMEYDSHAILLDSYSKGEIGGTGATFDWDIARDVRTLVERLYLAGGLSESNVADAIRKVRPFAVDACSRLESQPGKKDRDKVRKFISAVREAL